MSQITRIAKLLGASETVASMFCKDVQKMTRGAVPSHGEIEECLLRYPEFRSNASEIAARVVHIHKLTKPKQKMPKPKRARGGSVTLTPPDIRALQKKIGDWTSD